MHLCFKKITFIPFEWGFGRENKQKSKKHVKYIPSLSLPKRQSQMVISIVSPNLWSVELRLSEAQDVAQVHTPQW